MKELGLCDPASEDAVRLVRERLKALVPESYDHRRVLHIILTEWMPGILSSGAMPAVQIGLMET